MALSEKQKQKKLAKKKQKRKVHLKALNPNQLSTDKAISYAKFPIHECLIPSNLFESGLGTAIVTRRTLEGDIAICAFIVDVFCLGVKNALFKVVSENEYEHTLKPQIIESNNGIEFEKIHQTCARKLIEGAVQYANDLGFNSHPDYKNTKNIFGDIDSNVCPVKYVYGKEGKPYYMKGPNESIDDSKKIIDKLSKKCGEDGFEYVVMIDE
jgi:hypothetical protein